MLDLVPLEKPAVFVLETPSRMMAFLVADILDNPLELRLAIIVPMDKCGQTLKRGVDESRAPTEEFCHAPRFVVRQK
jgi:hypothetical protein